MKLIKIDEKLYNDYKTDVIFNAYKWDPQVEDSNTVSEYVLLIDEKTYDEINNLVKALSLETREIEKAFLDNKKLINKLNLPRKITKYLKKIDDYNFGDNVNLNRYDFHPTTKGWMISEVNSDVPGGLAESSLLPLIAKKYVKIGDVPYNLGKSLYESFMAVNKNIKNISFVHATSYSDDRQVMQFLGDYFDSMGLKSFYNAPEHLVFNENKIVFNVLEEENMDAIFRFFPLEWLDNLSKKYNYSGYFSNSITSCNHPVNILSQSKNVPLYFDKLNLELKTWKKMLPNTISIKEFNKNKDKYSKYIFKPVLGRVGEGISIKEAITDKEYKTIKKAVKKYPKDWIAQERFESVPLKTTDNEIFHLCLGVFSINDNSSGLYARISKSPRIDNKAIDIPVLIYKEDSNG